MDTGAIIKSLFDGDSWYSFHDSVYEATGISNSRPILMTMFHQLPIHIQIIAFEWGLSDTVFNDEVCKYITERLDKHELKDGVKWDR